MAQFLCLGRKMNVAIFYKHYPMAMGRYIHWGLEQAGHEVLSLGPWSKGEIPWEGVDRYPEKYWYPPTVETPDTPVIKMEDVFDTFKKADIKPDLLIQAADTYYISGKAPIPHIVIGTDPHVINYNLPKQHADKYFSMQFHYKEPDDGWMPYGFDPTLYGYFPNVKKEYDVVLCGLQYDHRKRVLSRVADKGFKVFSGIGHIYDEYVQLYNSAPIAFNWSSQLDLPARFWEGLAMRRCVVTNRVPDLRKFDFVDGEDYVGYDGEDEAVEKITELLKNPQEMERIAENGYKKVQPHTFKARVEKMLEEANVV